MPESDNTPAPKKPAKEITMEQRLLLAFFLMGLVLFSTQYFYKPAPAVKQTQPPSAKQVAKAPEPPKPAPENTPPPGQTMGQKEESFIVDTNVYRITFHNRGAVIRSWQLKKYKDNKGQPVELVNAAGADKAGYPLSIVFDNQKPSTDPNQALFAAKPLAGGLGVDYELSDGRMVVRKSFRFLRDTYLSEFSSEVRDGGTGVPHMLAWRGGFGDSTVAAAASTLRTLYFDTSQNKLIELDAGKAKDGPVTASGPFSFAGVEDTFFAAVFLPKENRPVKVQTIADTVTPLTGGKEEHHVGAAVGGDALNQVAVYVGPKDVNLLRRIDPKLEQVVDFGWFSFLAKPLFLALNWVNNQWTRNYGWAIVLVTIIINLLLMPLKLTSIKSMKKMSSLQPQIAAINEKYKSLSIRDPKKAQQNQEVMELYKKHGVNPVGGCVPLVLQIPFFIAFYKVLSVSIELRGAKWLWVSDLSQPETIAIRILPITMIATQFILQKMTPSTTADPAQQRIMLLMPLMMGFMFYGVSSGLVLYWLTGNLVGIAQQWLMNRWSQASSPAPAVIDVKPVKKTSKK